MHIEAGFRTTSNFDGVRNIKNRNRYRSTTAPFALDATKW